jgi:hypothetical protein
MANEREESLDTVEISFGSTFEGKKKGGMTRYVIIDLENGDHFGAAQFWYKEDILLIGQIGSTELSDIGKGLEEKFTLGQIIEGMNNRIGGNGISMEAIRMLTRNSSVSPRVLTS